MLAPKAAAFQLAPGSPVSTAAGTGQPTGTRQPRAAPESPRAGGEKIGSGQGTSTGPPKPEWDANEAGVGQDPCQG